MNVPAYDPDAPPVSEPLDAISSAALAHARRWNLVCENGEIVCLRDGCDQVATLPTLLCEAHLLARQHCHPQKAAR
jgi:hypothetical protein